MIQILPLGALLEMTVSWITKNSMKNIRQASIQLKVFFSGIVFVTIWKFLILAGTITTILYNRFSFITSVPNDVIASRRYSWNCSYYIIFCDVIKCAVFLLNMKFGRYLKVVNNKSIMFKLLITVGIWKFCI